MIELFYPIALLTSVTSTDWTPSMSARESSSGSVLPWDSFIINIRFIDFKPNATGTCSAFISPSPANSRIFFFASSSILSKFTSGDYGIIFREIIGWLYII